MVSDPRLFWAPPTSALRALQMRKQNSDSLNFSIFLFVQHARSYSDTSVSQKSQLTKQRINAFNRGRVSWKRRGSLSGLCCPRCLPREEKIEEEKPAERRKRDVNRNLLSPHLLLKLWQLFALRMSFGECWSDSLGEART